MKLTIIILLLSFTCKAQLKWNLTPEQDLTFDYYTSLISTVETAQLLDRLTNHKKPFLCNLIATSLNAGIIFLERSQGGKVVRGSAIAAGFMINLCISNYKDDKIYEAEQLCKDLKNPIFLKDSIR